MQCLDPLIPKIHYQGALNCSVTWFGLKYTQIMQSMIIKGTVASGGGNAERFTADKETMSTDPVLLPVDETTLLALRLQAKVHFYSTKV